MDELKPCPFCGGPASYKVWSDHEYHCVECFDCSIEMNYFDSKQEAVDFWNRRTPEKAE